MTELEQLTKHALLQISDADSLDALDTLRVGLLGKSGLITLQLKQLGAIAADQRKAAGEQINRSKEVLTDAIQDKKLSLEQAALAQRLASERID
ncbi:MAG: phenylalanine--tRNA ligase subunit alpha, partial [Arenimonas sp.]|nr:phenylalanine--tRNA ligase subunit alpha [Arenimonas sp.]